MKTSFSRRQFIRTHLGAALAASACPALASRAVLGRTGTVPPNSRVALGCIGVGPQGRGNLSSFLGLPEVEVSALCDVAQRNLNVAANQVKEKHPGQSCSLYQDYRELLARKDIDAVLIATPDHWHVPIALAAAKAGKDIYLEKPMGLSVEDDQALRTAVLRHKRVFQFGTQQRSSKEFRLACELVRNGQIGKLQKINVWCQASRPGGSTAPAPVPNDLDYEHWLGPAPVSPYTVDKCFDVSVPGAWKTWWYQYDHALGFIAGWGVHPLDIAYWGHPHMMKGPLTVQGQVLIPSQGACNTGIAWDVHFRFADGVEMQYRGTPNGYSARNELNDMGEWEARYGKIPDHGTAFEGTEGWIVVYRGGLRTAPAKLSEESIDLRGVHLPHSSNHQRNFIEAVRSRAKTICPIEDAVQADILCHLSDIASRLGRKLTWDPTRERFLGDSEANRKLARRPSRKASSPWPS